MSPAHPLVVEMVRARTERGVHHTGVHDTTGIARSTVRNWETGRRDPQLAPCADFREENHAAAGGQCAREALQHRVVAARNGEPMEDDPAGQLLRRAHPQERRRNRCIAQRDFDFLFQ